MTQRSAYLLLGVLAVGVFLAGLELMVTAVALPSIVADLADWTRLREASWIINGYLLVYVVTMPLAGRLTDLWGARRLFFGGLVAFTVGSLLAGASQTLEQLLGARLVQAVGGGTLVPVATAAASHLFEGHRRPRALGIIGALTFLGMAAGPFVGAAILETAHLEVGLSNSGITTGPLVDLLTPAWRWVFYLNLPIGIVVLAIAWAASTEWEISTRPGSVDLGGAILLSAALATGLVGLTLIDASLTNRLLDPTYPPIPLLFVAVVATVAAVARSLKRTDPFLDPRLFHDRIFRSAALVSLLTGYALATAIIGGAVFVDRVLYGGPGDQQISLGALAGATAVGALVSGFVTRVLSLRVVTVAGLLGSAAALVWMATWTASTTIQTVALALGIFGLGFGLTVTARSTAAVEAVGRRAFGTASAVVTVARMVGMAVGLAILTAYGSTTIDRLYLQVYATPDAYKQYIPAELRDRPLKDGLVVDALERWVAGEAARVMVGLFVVAAGLTVIAIPAGLALESRPRILAADTAATSRSSGAARGTDGPDEAEPTVAF